ncbi:hypothetical protein DOM21_17300 [Bacteriovorax stolpii]|uniref:Uncharacterized protein n=1 Tax=Bacteriovorax stolpii TaxID=960 RepID=A0A2K9NN25_BACTC|nr:hypothetical protein [Bacteriovorax stolpii]AUN96892.1 hypothetical protein C0V70_01975 [Bacteriovorax stolpii]QDK43179.1 hypothetical protein DOM21_17300 [Bacteriovorax stolpii]TDP53170.1 hypothetical protein C8D79_1812 [Bacteriovorax stolpii]
MSYTEYLKNRGIRIDIDANKRIRLISEDQDKNRIYQIIKVRMLKKMSISNTEVPSFSIGNNDLITIGWCSFYQFNPFQGKLKQELYSPHDFKFKIYSNDNEDGSIKRELQQAVVNSLNLDKNIFNDKNDNAFKEKFSRLYLIAISCALVEHFDQKALVFIEGMMPSQDTLGLMDSLLNFYLHDYNYPGEETSDKLKLFYYFIRKNHVKGQGPIELRHIQQIVGNFEQLVAISSEARRNQLRKYLNEIITLIS